MDIAETTRKKEQTWYEILDPTDLAKINFEPGYVRDPVHGHLRLIPEDFFVLDVPPFQRLRSVSQLSFVDRVYPGANHTRFEHCLGTAYLAERIMENLRTEQHAQQVREISKSDVWTVKIAAYLHDIGHLPFSHAVEPIFEQVDSNHDDDRPTHEKIGFETIVTRYFTELLAKMNSEFKTLNLDQRRIALLACGRKNDVPDSDLFMYEIIHGKPVDCDRLDYLLRDAYYSGVPHGDVDVERLVETFTLIERNNGVHLAIDESGLLALEAMAVSRSTMYGAVYNHHTSRIIEGMILRGLHYQQQKDKETLESIVGNTDGFVIELLSRGCKIAKEMANRLLYRRFFKRIFDEKVSVICGLKPNMDYTAVLGKFGDSFSSANKEFKTWSKRIEFEEKCLLSEDHAGLAMVDCPKLKLPEPPMIDIYTPIRLEDGSARSILEMSPIVYAVEMERDSYATSILCAASSDIPREVFGDRVKRALRDTFGIVI